MELLQWVWLACLTALVLAQGSVIKELVEIAKSTADLAQSAARKAFGLSRTDHGGDS